MLNFVTAQSLENTSGGWSGISANIYKQLQARFATTYVGEIYPPIPPMEKLISKTVRVIGGRGGMPIFEPKRLNAVRREWAVCRDPHARFEMFHAATEWSACKPSIPYGSYVDATFRMYMDIYSTQSAFSEASMAAISAREKAWLNGASALFFGSRWVRDIALQEHDLDPSKCHVMWVGGNVPVPTSDQYKGGKRFLFVSLNFEKKGGRIAVQALQRVRRNHPDAELLVLGQKPPESVISLPGVVYGGMLRKTVPEELAQFQHHVATARALVHPTSMDTMGAVLIEAGYCGCPSIATRRFGIPELVLDGKTGLLIDAPISSEQVAQHMQILLENEGRYREMRAAVRQDTIERLTWDAFGDRMASVLKQWLDTEPGREKIHRGRALELP